MLDAQLTPGGGILGEGDVAGGVQARLGRALASVDGHGAVRELEAG